MRHWSFSRFCTIAWLMVLATNLQAQILDRQALLNRETFWDNRDFDWFADHIPFFDCPDVDLTTTYYYRWELVTKHLTYGSPQSGYSFTEFIDRPFWSGAYGAISCPAGHQLYEARWLNSPRVARDYSKYWFRTPGAQPRNYSTWLADSIWAVHQVHPDKAWLVELLPDLIANYEAWEKRHFDAAVGLFWQTGHDDGMEFNINSRQTQDILRGAPSYRPSFNAYMWADALAIARVADLAGQTEMAEKYRAKADALKAKLVELMWDEKRQFFFPVLKNDEEREGFRMRALTRTYESGRFAGDSHGRELIGYVPWQFNMFPGQCKYDVAWKKLIDRDGFDADYGPSTVERNDPLFLLKNSCCWWSGQSWPYATTQTLKGLANWLQQGGQTITASDYVRLLSRYARSHRKDGRPYLAEALHPDTGSFEGHDGYNHSEHYFHSGYVDLLITGLVGLIPRDDETVEICPLAPSDWEYLAVDHVPYRGHELSIVWDKSGTRYGLGAGLHLLVDGQKMASSPRLERMVVPKAVPSKPMQFSATPTATRVNYAVNNEGTYYPRVSASYTAEGSSTAKLNDGNYWYTLHPPNRWTCDGSTEPEDWVEIDFGTLRQVDTIRAFILDDRQLPDSRIRAPQSVRWEYWSDGQWKRLIGQTTATAIEGHRPVQLKFEPLALQRLRVTFTHAQAGRSGLTELEVWGDAVLPIESPPPPAGNLAFNDGKQAYPKTKASYQDRFGGEPRKAIDGITNFAPSPMNRWTSYESPNAKDWLEIDFGREVKFGRVELAIYDDRGGVQAPTDYKILVRENEAWKEVEGVVKNPLRPAGGQWNAASFPATASQRVRIEFTNRGQARSGVTEVMVWEK